MRALTALMQMLATGVDTDDPFIIHAAQEQFKRTLRIDLENIFAPAADLFFVVDLTAVRFDFKSKSFISKIFRNIQAP